MKTSIKPNNYFSGFREMQSLKAEIQSKKTGIQPDDQFMYDMATSKGWELLDEYINSIKKDLDLMIHSLMEEGASYEVIGQKTIVKELTKELLEKVQNKVYDSIEAVEQNDGTKS